MKSNSPFSYDAVSLCCALYATGAARVELGNQLADLRAALSP
jgi:hypothetical protein